MVNDQGTSMSAGHDSGGRLGARSDLYAETLKLTEAVLGLECDPALDFFDLGGASLQVVQIVTMLNDRYGIDISITDAFDAVDLRAFADLVCAKAEAR
jgi:acyl carrier protein